MNRYAIVLGGSGFIGTRLIARLHGEGRHLVLSVDRRPPTERLDGVNYVQMDVRDLSGLDVPGPADCIYNLAAIHTTPGHPTHEYYDTNVAGATQAAALARRLDVPEMVFTSSISVYGPSEDTKSETTEPSPESAYGWSKWLAEGIHRAWLDERPDRRLVIVRPAVIFGPGEGGNFTRMARLLRRGLFLFPGRRDTVKACFYVEDLIDAVLFAQAKRERYILFNGCYPDRYTIGQIVDTMRQVHFARARTVLLPQALLLAAASLLRPLSAAGLGIHPDRVRKLVRSTDVVPGWLSSVSQAEAGRLPLAIERWKQASAGRFD